MSKPTYERLRKLANDLLQETRVKARRDIGNQLLETLTKDDVRRRLAHEAIPQSRGPDDPSLQASCCYSLSQLWTFAIKGAISVVHSIQSGKSKAKLALEDVTLPKKLLVACVKPDSVFEGIEIPKLSRATVRYILKYALNLLADESVLNLAEMEVLDLLLFLCSREEYVPFFKNPSDLENIWQEVTLRLTDEVEKDFPSIFEKASEILDALFSTCYRLGLENHTFVPRMVELVFKWCKQHLVTQTTTPQFLIGGLSTLMNAYPDRAIGSVRQYGRALLSYWKRNYASAKGLTKDALNRYMLAHL